MKSLHFLKPNNLDRLHDQLVAALPALRPVPNTVGRLDPVTGQVALEPVIAVEGRGDDIWLTVPDNADEVAIVNVIAAHDPLAPRPRTPNELAQAQARDAAADALLVALDTNAPDRKAKLLALLSRMQEGA